MDDKTIERINELYRKMKSVGLTKEEELEQQELRQAYIAAIRRNLRGTLDNVSILNEDGTVSELKEVGSMNRKHLN